MASGETSIDFSTHELLLLAELSDVATPTGLGEASFDSYPEAVRDWLRDSARSSLTARRVLTGEPPALAPSVEAILGVAGHPGVLIIVSVEGDGVVETSFLAASPELGVAHTAVATDVHRLTPFPSREILARAIRLADVRPVPVPTIGPVTADVDVFTQVAEAIEDHRSDDAEQVLIDGGVGPEAARAVVDAFRERQATTAVTVIYKPEPDVAAGGSLSWLDAGMQGLWVTEHALPEPPAANQPLDPNDAVTLTLTPMTAQGIAAELLTYLPDPFGDRPAPGTVDLSAADDD